MAFAIEGNVALGQRILGVRTDAVEDTGQIGRDPALDLAVADVHFRAIQTLDRGRHPRPVHRVRRVRRAMSLRRRAMPAP